MNKILEIYHLKYTVMNKKYTVIVSLSLKYHLRFDLFGHT